MDNKIRIADIVDTFKKFGNINKNTLIVEDVKKILYDPKEQFDVVLIEWMFHELLSG